MRVVGFEGGGSDSPLTFGSAAFQDKRTVVNAVTKATVPIERWRELVASGHAVAVKPHVLRTGLSMSPRQFVEATKCSLLRIRGRNLCEARRIFKLHAVDSWLDTTDDRRYFLFNSLDALLRAATEAAPILAKSGAATDQKAASILQCTLDAPLVKQGLSRVPEKGKLVRDRVLDRITRDGCAYRARVAERGEMWDLLMDKLEEEVAELRRADGRGPRLEELADVLEVVRAMMELLGPREVDQAVAAKERTHGRLGRTVLIEWTKK